MNSTNEFVTQLKGLITEQINNIHTAIPGEIVSVNALNGTVKVKPKASMSFSTGAKLDYPTLNNVPVVMPFSVNGNCSVVFPIHKGDQCLVIFSEQALETWRGTGNIGSQIKHGLSGAICLPGLMKTSPDDFVEAVNSDAVIIREGENSIKLSKSSITLTGEVYVQGNITIKGELKQA